MPMKVGNIVPVLVAAVLPPLVLITLPLVVIPTRGFQISPRRFDSRGDVLAIRRRLHDNENNNNVGIGGRFPSSPASSHSSPRTSATTTLTYSLSTALSSSSFRDTATTTTALHSHSAVLWAAGHVLCGAAPLPWVSKAVKGWYRKIALPSWTPPDKTFPTVWTALYATIGIAASRVANRAGAAAAAQSPAMIAWAVHMALNLSWAVTFFGAKRLRLGCVISSLMVLTLLPTMALFYRTDPLSSFLLLPYLMWITFATILNATICKLNPTTNGYNEAMRQADLMN